MTRLSYLICATPRSGTTLLCDLLTDTGIAGKPASYFRRQSILRWVDRFGLTPPTRPDDAEFERAYLAAVIKAGSGDAEIFGLRLMWESLRELLARLSLLHPEEHSDRGLLERAFGTIRYVHLSRQDKVAQAISRLKAEQSGLWHMAADGTDRERIGAPREPDYDADRIEAYVRESSKHDAAWGQWFAEQNIEPLRLTYEELSVNPGDALSRVLDGLGLDMAKADTVKVKTRKMADEDSVDWAVRFGVERGGRR